MNDNEMMVQETENEEEVYYDNYEYDEEYEDEVEKSTGLGKLILGIAIGGVAAFGIPKAYRGIKKSIAARRQKKNKQYVDEHFEEAPETPKETVENNEVDDAEEE